MSICLNVCMCAPCVSEALRGRKWASDPLELEFGVIVRVSHAAMGVLDSNACALQEQSVLKLLSMTHFLQMPPLHAPTF